MIDLTTANELKTTEDSDLAEFEYLSTEEQYVHVTKENAVIDKLTQANPGSKETKRADYEEGQFECKVSSPTNTIEDED